MDKGDKRNTKKEGGTADMASSIATFPIIRGDAAKKLKEEFTNPTQEQKRNHEDAYMRALRLRKSKMQKPIK